jgi:hypothetical protein
MSTKLMLILSLDWLNPIRGDLCPEGGYRAQPRVSTLGTLKINEFALKGREADQTNLAPVAAQKLLVRSICRPLRARRSGRGFPGLKPWAKPHRR